MIFRQLFDAASSSYTYVLADEETHEGLVIDSVRDQRERDAALIADLELRLVYVLETHVHADHITGASALRDRFGAKLVATRISGPPCCDWAVADGDAVRFGRHELRVLHTPGHTAGCLCYHGDGRVFTGDALLVRTCGRTDLQGGDPGALWDSITGKLFVLPEETLVYPAHDYKGHTVTSIGEEKRHNVRLAGRSRADFIALMEGLSLPMPRRIAEAVPANLACGCLPEETLT